MENLKLSSQDTAGVRSIFINLLAEKFGVPPKLLTGNNDNDSLTGRIFSFRPRTLVYLFYEVERIFNIHISTESILNGHFNTIHNIVEIIEKEISLSHKK